MTAIQFLGGSQHERFTHVPDGMESCRMSCEGGSEIYNRQYHTIGDYDFEAFVIEGKNLADLVFCCQLCGDIFGDSDEVTKCADCGTSFCDYCGGWCGDEHDIAKGDYFCDDCQGGETQGGNE